MAISITDWGSDSLDTFAVTVYSHRIKTTVTTNPTVVDAWISEIKQNPQISDLIVGLDVEWRPSFSRHQNPVATLQLCIDHHCLIYQLIHTPSIPQSLRDFLKDPDFSFVGVGIGEDVEKLVVDYDLEVARTVDIGNVAAEKMGLRRNVGLKELAKEVMGLQIEKPRRVTMGRWDSEWLSYDQIQYACVDAFLSSEIGKRLVADGP